MTRAWLRPSFANSPGAGALGSLRATLGVGTSVQILSALAGFVALPIIAQALGGSRFGVLVVVVSLAPWLTIIDGALYPTIRLLVGETRDARFAAPQGLLRSAVRFALRIAALNLGTLLMGLAVLPLVALFGSQGIADRHELIAAILAFALPIIASGPSGVFLGALEGVGRTAVAAMFAGSGPLVALPLTLLAVHMGGGLVALCAAQGVGIALPRLCTWVYWHVRPSVDRSSDAGAAALRPALLFQMVVLSAALLVQSGLDPVIVSSQLGAHDAGAFGVATRLVYGALIPLTVLSPLFAANLAAARGSGRLATHGHELRRLILQATAVGLLVACCLTALGPVVARVLGAGEIGAPITLYLAGGAFVFATFFSTPLYLALSGPQGLARTVRLHVALMVVNIVLSVLLVRVVGVSGPLWASAIAALAGGIYWLVLWEKHPAWLREAHTNDGGASERSKG